MIQERPAASVIIPAHNEEAYIASALQAADSQTYAGAIECIVVDNASGDRTAEIALAFGTNAGVTTRVVEEPALGVGAAKNRGAESASGDVLIFVDADSRMRNDLVAAVLTRYQQGYLAGSIRVAGDGGAWIDRFFFQLMEFGKVRFGIRAQMLFCDRELFFTLGGFNPKLKLGEDVDLLKRIQRELKKRGAVSLCHVTESEICTSPRRLQANHHLGMAGMLGRWALAFVGIGRSRSY